MTEKADQKPSRTQLKRQAEDLQALGERLVAMPEPSLARLPLPPALLDAVRVARSLSQRGALRRQRQYIGRLMRELETDRLQAAIEALDHENAARKAEFHDAEAWRDRLLAGDAADMEAFFDAHPHADRQRIRQLVRSAVAGAARGQSARNRRELFREIRANLKAGFE